jgi:hypothetical protein
MCQIILFNMSNPTTGYKKKVIEYIEEVLCFLGFHRYGEWKNGSIFKDTGFGFNFGWVAQYERKCKYCGNYSYKTPFLRSERKRIIKEAMDKKHYI